MKEENFEEQTPKEKRSIRDIPIPVRHDDDEDDRHVIVDGIKANHSKKPRFVKEAQAKAHEPEEYIELEPAFADAETETRHVHIDDIKSRKPRTRKAKAAHHEEAEVADRDGHKHAEHRAEHHAPARRHFEEQDPLDAITEKRRKRKKGPLTYAAIGIGACALLFGIIQYFTHANIEIKPTKHELSLASVELPLDEIDHKIIEASDEGSENVQANGTLKVEKKATGKVIIYNTYSSASQRLIATTRIEAPNGLIYMLTKAVTVPGTKTVNGKVQAGSVEADVEAEKPGEAYNIGLRDFKIVGFKGTAKYDKFYGRSKTNMTGGIVDTVPNIPQAALTTAQNAVKQEALAAAELKFSEQIEDIGADYVYLADSRVVEYTKANQTVTKDGKTASIAQKATITGVAFSKDSLLRYLVKNESDKPSLATDPIASDIATSVSATSSSIDIVDESRLAYTGDTSGIKAAVDSASATAAKLKGKEASIMANGTVTISSAVIPDRIAKAVSGLSREQAVAALQKIIDLESVEVSIWPWWKSKMPARAAQINIELVD